MNTAFDCLNNYYSSYDEHMRFSSKNGSIEFLTTIRYVERYLKPGMKILEIGAASGRYSHFFARAGYTVDAVELIPRNIELFRENTEPDENVTIRQGNATDLSFLSDNTYDVTLLLGPMYHLFTDDERMRALSEAVRVTKSGGIMAASYCMNESTVIQYLFGKHNLKAELERGLVDRETFKCDSTPEDVFVLWRREEIDRLVNRLPAKRLHFVGTDMYTKYHPEMVDSLDDFEFEQYLKYHFYICERADMVGISNHTLDILRKD